MTIDLPQDILIAIYFPLRGNYVRSHHIYAARGGINAVIVESKAVGGQAALTAEIENYPGFDNINGFDLVSRMQAQCERLGVTFVYDNPVNVSLDGEIKRVETAYSGSIEARAVILATGCPTRAR